MKRFWIASLGIIAFAAMALAAGEGAAIGFGIYHSSNTSSTIFNFRAKYGNGEVAGMLSLVDISGDPRMPTVHFLRMKVEKFACDANHAQFAGHAGFDGKAAVALVDVWDNRKPAENDGKPDAFQAIVFNSTGNAVWKTAGEVKRGDIAVRCAK